MLPGIDLEFVLNIRVSYQFVLGFGLYIDYTGPKIDGEHEFTVKHSSQHVLRKHICTI